MSLEYMFLIDYKQADSVDALYNTDIDTIEAGAGYTFEDFLKDNNVSFEIEDDDFYYVLDGAGDRTGEVFQFLEIKEKDIFSFSDVEMLEIIENAAAWDEKGIIEAMEFLCNRYDVDMYDGSENRYNDDILQDLKKVVK